MDQTSAYKTLQGLSMASLLQVNSTINFYLTDFSPLRPSKAGAQMLRHLLLGCKCEMLLDPGLRYPGVSTRGC